MPTTGIANATLYLLRIGSEAVAECTSVDVQLTAGEVDTTSKSSAGWKARRPGLISGTVTVQGNLRFDTGASDQGIAELYAAFNGRTKVTLKAGTNVSGDKTIDADAYITSLNIGAGVEDNITIEASFKFTGAITQETNA
jgi:predicted secreted protein